MTALNKTRSRLSAARLRENLAGYQRTLMADRDEARAAKEEERESDFLHGWYFGRAAAAELALAYLNTWTDGEFGISLEDQRAEEQKAEAGQ
ncbi:hypothetical protein [Amycolatopsis palatopharyngis]|uniref:hypothetical protein n=1 Tax=Amycolatopsis palatopharyngis TaxID=187982 RepID=UPI000E27D7C5|nr:hypothetical protein [Amycolatopsis palatopharyngis]